MNLDQLPARIRDKVRVHGECWIWTGAVNSRGYSCTSVNGRSALAHRVVYELAHGPIAEGLEVDHLCRVIVCVRPVHLEAVTCLENMRRRAAAYTVCRRGHAMTGTNVIVHRRTNGKTHRECRECALDRRRAA